MPWADCWHLLTHHSDKTEVSPLCPGEVASLSFLAVLLACPLTIHLSVTIWLFFFHHMWVLLVRGSGSLANPPGVLLRIWADLGLKIQAAVGLVGYWVGDEQVLHWCCDPPLPCCRTWKLTAEVLLQCMEMGAKRYSALSISRL